ncbi:MAG: reverse transcriptase family protein [Sedimenticola sp.]
MNGVESRIIPDHYLLSCSCTLRCLELGGKLPRNKTVIEKRVTRYDVSSIPDSFCNDADTVAYLQALGDFEEGIQTQLNIDKAYDDFCLRLTQEMSTKLPHRQVVIQYGVSNRRMRVRKPWWNDGLQTLWNDMCSAERTWLKCRNGQKHTFKHVYVQARRLFDQNVQRRKRNYWFDMQREMIENANHNNNDFWKFIGRVGTRDNRKQEIPMEFINEDGELVTEHNEVLEKWKTDFCSLLNPSADNLVELDQVDVMYNVDDNVNDMHQLACDFTMSEVKTAVYKVKKNRSAGVDNIPGEVLKNDNVIAFLHKLCNMCYRSGTVPDIWSKSLICPIPKGTSSDPRDPLSYRGIAITPVAYKVYCTLLNDRVTKWTELKGILYDGQNGFRKGRSTIDHISALTNIIETRKKMKKSTFCAFIDFKKAYDSINRDILWSKLDKLGFTGTLLNAIKSIYNNVLYSVKLNGFTTDFFSVTCGLKQGCSLSPILFNLYINDLSLKIRALGKGVRIDDDIVSILLFADDVVLIAESEADLQAMLNELGDWCVRNAMNINPTKSNIVQFRNPSVMISDFIFNVNGNVVSYASQYKYLGLVLSEHLDFNITAKTVAQSAGRALGLLIAKSKTLGGLQYDVFTKLYESIVCPVILYGAAIWGTRSYTCINAVHNRAARYFLNVGRYTPNAAVNGDIGWQPIEVQCWKTVLAHWCRSINMIPTRLNKSIFRWSTEKCNRRCNNWSYRVIDMLKSFGSDIFCRIDQFISKAQVLNTVLPLLTDKYISQWSADVSRVDSRTGRGGNKLRLYMTFKHEYCVESYCKQVFNRSHRGALSKFRSGTAPIALEHGRYTGLPVNERYCFNCNNVVEDEKHVLLVCPLYDNIRIDLFEEARGIIANFDELSVDEKVAFILSNPNIAKLSAKTCSLILNKRRDTLYR